MRKLTFGRLGMPFPLFDADYEQAELFAQHGDCFVCKKRDCHFLFHVHLIPDGYSAQEEYEQLVRSMINLPTNLRPQSDYEREIQSDALVVVCPTCETSNGFFYRDGKAISCSCCREVLPHPLSEPGGHFVGACYDCINQGRVAFLRWTEWGVVSFRAWKDELTWNLHNAERLQEGTNSTSYEVVVDHHSNGEECYRVALPREKMELLLRTPGYKCIQTPDWLFHCGEPMVYLGMKKKGIRPAFSRITSFVARSAMWFVPSHSVIKMKT